MGSRPHFSGSVVQSHHRAYLIISLQAIYKFAKASVCLWTRSSKFAGAGFLWGSLSDRPAPNGNFEEMP